ncbi:hypothetical protein Q4603_18830 [Zobellia galactanivorans]|uniref:Uncharacterized protein n=1 Tax=Zobellia galactanivorans (strain DSM 12802 / CCUG 47099 / CIP 106680 / NCIMB 13871 / Dsij) TaxID=63186 RepID=G0L0M3_ZOBGA|nr:MULTISPECIES: hypothetical protein [Zobellia]MBU3024756.1 hypothetical protein [Zobellia galactanivorans]MDO6810686.1 hypothetical protein [Zobellia galactanivorans]OWW23237.1 hypothetical protein B4Q04_21740 [Zobellia sp. OII3]CAZ97511.1 Hypothetical protein ZOBELLIA_3373 [Zobellia galactanivorans]
MKRHLLSQYNSLEEIMEFLKTKTDLTLSIVQDQWVTDGSLSITPGKKCILVKKSATAGAKINLLESSIVDVHPVPPSTFVNNMTQRGILAIVVHMIISGSQNKVAEEVEKLLLEIQKD